MVDTPSSLRSTCDLRVTVFERRQGSTLSWHTIGLGELNRTERGPSALKLQQRIIHALRKAIAKKWPAEIESLEFVPGRTLHAVELDALIGEPRRRVRGKFSLVLEPRGRGGDEAPLWIAYHPLRPHEWFPHGPDRSLADEANSFFRERWATLEPDAIDRLRASPREALRLFGFSASCRSLLELLDDGRRPDARPLLGADERRRGAALLAELGRNETELVAEGGIPLGAERSPWSQQLRQLLCGEHRSSVLLVGPSGCGKSTLLRRVIHDRLEADGWAVHRNLDRTHAVWSIRGSRLIAGMSYLGQWEQRCVDLLEACRTERALLWIEDLPAWGRTGESREADRSLATFFRGPIARGELTVLAECTPEQLQMLQDDAPELAAAFTTLWVDPADAGETARLVHHTARRLELTHGVAFDASAFRTIAELGGALSPTAAEPGKSVELLHALARGEYGFSLDLDEVERELAAGRRLHAIRRWRELTGGSLHAAVQAVDQFATTGIWPALRESGGTRPPTTVLHGTLDPRFEDAPRLAGIGHSAVVRLLARRTGVPEVLLVPQRSLGVDAVRASFAEQVIGQATAVAAVSDIILRMRTQLDDRTRPYGVLLLSGPTGTGKTELAKCVAEYLYGDPKRLVRLDMSEYGGADAVARLVGDRARPEGVLTQAVRAQPFCVVLLDEIDKADPAILALMLQVFDDGRLTDAAGQVVDFSHAVVLMTSNLGATTERAIGLGASPGAARRELARAVQEFFAPELFNRIDRVVPFDSLSPEGATRIAQRELQQLLGRDGLVERNVFVRFTPAVIDFVVAHGFAARDGARSLKRWLEDHIGAWLADEIAGGPIAAVRVFWLYVRDGRLELHGEHLVEATWRAEPGAMQQLLERDARTLRRGLPDALAAVEAVLDSPALGRLGQTMSEHVTRSVAGDTIAAQTAYSLERLRGELLELRDRLRVQADYDPLLADDGGQDEVHGELIEADRFGWARRAAAHGHEVILRALDPRGQVPDLPLRTRPQVLALLDELRLLETAVAHADDPDEHAVLIDLSRVSRARPEGRFARPRAGLLEWLADGYAGVRADVDERVAVTDDTIVHYPDQVPEVMHGSCDRIVLRITGPGVRSRFRAEDGCHVLHALSGATEIVRVQVRSGIGEDAESHARTIAQRRQQFAAALEHGPPEHLPENPDAVPPIVRAYHFDAVPTGAPAPIVVEDHPLGHVLRLHVARLADVLPTLWMLRPDPAAQEGETP